MKISFSVEQYLERILPCWCLKSSNWCVGEVLFHILLCVLIFIPLLNFTICRWFFLSHNGNCFLQATLFINTVIMASFKVLHQEVTLSVQLNNVKLEIVKLFFRQFLLILVLD